MPVTYSTRIGAETLSEGPGSTRGASACVELMKVADAEEMKPSRETVALDGCSSKELENVRSKASSVADNRRWWFR